MSHATIPLPRPAACLRKAAPLKTMPIAADDEAARHELDRLSLTSPSRASANPWHDLERLSLELHDR